MQPSKQAVGWGIFHQKYACLTNMYKSIGSTFSTGQSSLWQQRTGNRRQERTQISCHLSFSEHDGTYLCSVHLGSGDRRIRSLRQPSHIGSHKPNNQLFYIKGHYRESKRVTHNRNTSHRNRSEKDGIEELAFTTTKGPRSQTKVSKGLNRHVR